MSDPEDKTLTSPIGHVLAELGRRQAALVVLSGAGIGKMYRLLKGEAEVSVEKAGYKAEVRSDHMRTRPDDLSVPLTFRLMPTAHLTVRVVDLDDPELMPNREHKVPIIGRVNKCVAVGPVSAGR